MKNFFLKTLGALLLLLPTFAFAEDIYLHTMSVLDFVMMIVFGLCHIVGVVFIFLSFVYYRRFRQNSNEMPLSRVIWVLVLGIIIFCIPWLAQINGIYGEIQTAGSEAPLT